MEKKKFKVRKIYKGVITKTANSQIVAMNVMLITWMCNAY